ncbi:MAG TPA: hypothetical protein VGA37_15945 [Gemmatimonadales bacterium]
MPGYIIVDIEVTNPARYEEYKRLAAAHRRHTPRRKRCGTVASRSRMIVIEGPLMVEGFAVDPDAAEHRPGRDRDDPAQLLERIFTVTIADGHRLLVD